MAAATKPKHTPGPWSTAGSRVYAGDYATQGEPDLILDVVSASPDEDARLIAAAPDLLAALRGLVMHVEALQRAGKVSASEFDLTNHRAAIAKAEGE